MWIWAGHWWCGHFLQVHIVIWAQHKVAVHLYSAPFCFVLILLVLHQCANVVITEIIMCKSLWICLFCSSESNNSGAGIRKWMASLQLFVPWKHFIISEPTFRDSRWRVITPPTNFDNYHICPLLLYARKPWYVSNFPVFGLNIILARCPRCRFLSGI